MGDQIGHFDQQAMEQCAQQVLNVLGTPANQLVMPIGWGQS